MLCNLMLVAKDRRRREGAIVAIKAHGRGATRRDIDRCTGEAAALCVRHLNAVFGFFQRCHICINKLNGAARFPDLLKQLQIGRAHV